MPVAYPTELPIKNIVYRLWLIQSVSADKTTLHGEQMKPEA